MTTNPDQRPPTSIRHDANRRRRDPSPRSKQVLVRLNTHEYDQLATAAAAAELTTTSYVAETALAAARATSNQRHDPYGITRTELAQLQQDLFTTRTTLNQLATHLPNTTVPTRTQEQLHHCTLALTHLDKAIDAIDKHLRQPPETP